MKYSVEFEELPFVPGDGGMLGRHVEHDDRSKNFPVETGSQQALRSVTWPRRSVIFDQGEIGSCTGNAITGAEATDSINRRGTSGLIEWNALDMYERITRSDRIPGSYPPDDTGSTGLAACKTAKARGWISSYRHAFSLHAMLHALQTGPAIVGMAWLTGCDTPNSNGLISYTGDVRGGHEILCRGVDIENHWLYFDNSWGSDWGMQGSFAMTFPDFEMAMADSGDMTVPLWT